jgi:sec-independent protein translocase protein TatB
LLQIGFLEIAIILIIGLLVIGPERFPEIFKNLLKFYKKIQNQLSEFKNNFEEDIGADEIKKDVFNEMRMEELEGFEQKKKDE